MPYQREDFISQGTISCVPLTDKSGRSIGAQHPFIPLDYRVCNKCTIHDKTTEQQGIFRLNLTTALLCIITKSPCTDCIFQLHLLVSASFP